MNICFLQIKLNDPWMTGLIGEVSHQHGQCVETADLTHAAPPSHAHSHKCVLSLENIAFTYIYSPQAYPKLNKDQPQYCNSCRDQHFVPSESPERERYILF